MKDIKNVISVRLKTLQEKRGVSNVELATATDINKASISQYRSGSREPDAESLVKIAKYFNVSVDYLLGINDIESANITEQEICKRMHITKDALDKWEKKFEEVSNLISVKSFVKEGDYKKDFETANDEFLKEFNRLISEFDILDFFESLALFNITCKKTREDFYEVEKSVLDMDIKEANKCYNNLFLAIDSAKSHAYALERWIYKTTALEIEKLEGFIFKDTEHLEKWLI